MFEDKNMVEKKIRLDILHKIIIIMNEKDAHTIM